MPNVDQFQRIYGLSVADVDLPTPSPVVSAKSTTKRICVQKVVFAPTTWAGGTLLLLDSKTGKAIGRLDVPLIPFADGAQTMTLDYGQVGTKLSAGAHLLVGVTPTSAPIAGRLHVESYQRNS